MFMRPRSLFSRGPEFLAAGFFGVALPVLLLAFPLVSAYGSAVVDAPDGTLTMKSVTSGHSEKKLAGGAYYEITIHRVLELKTGLERPIPRTAVEKRLKQAVAACGADDQCQNKALDAAEAESDKITKKACGTDTSCFYKKSNERDNELTWLSTGDALQISPCRVKVSMSDAAVIISPTIRSSFLGATFDVFHYSKTTKKTFACPATQNESPLRLSILPEDGTYAIITDASYEVKTSVTENNHQRSDLLDASFPAPPEATYAVGEPLSGKAVNSGIPARFCCLRRLKTKSAI